MVFSFEDTGGSSGDGLDLIAATFAGSCQSLNGALFLALESRPSSVRRTFAASLRLIEDDLLKASCRPQASGTAYILNAASYTPKHLNKTKYNPGMTIEITTFI